MTPPNTATRQQEVDTTRAHELLTENPEYATQLVYRYADTGEIISVPNVWYNQTPAYRVMCLLAQAEYFRRKAENFLKAPDDRLSEAGNQQIAQRYLGRAREFENKANALCLPA